jgi:hypothetical protein
MRLWLCGPDTARYDQESSLTAFIKVTRKFGLTLKDQSILYFDVVGGTYEITDEQARDPFVKEHSVRTASPSGRILNQRVVPPTTPPRRQISAPLPEAPSRLDPEPAPVVPDTAAIDAANAEAKAKEEAEKVFKDSKPKKIDRFTGAKEVARSA